MARDIVFYHAPQTRSTGVRVLLEELGAEVEIRVLNMKAGEQRQAGFLAVNPLGKVPALVDRGELVTEQVAIYLHLAELFPDAGLAPAAGERLRGPYLRWMAFYAASFEPAVVDRALKREPGPASMSPYGDFDAVMGVVTEQLSRGDYLLGERFSAADVLWGLGLGWTTGFGLVASTPVIDAYVKRVMGRPAAVKVTEEDARLVAAQATPA